MQVSATFAASLVTSPALGAWLSAAWSDDAVVALATCVAAADVFVILVAVPESLPPKLRHSWDRVTWEHADPFAVSRRSVALFGHKSIAITASHIAVVATRGRGPHRVGIVSDRVPILSTGSGPILLLLRLPKAGGGLLA